MKQEGGNMVFDPEVHHRRSVRLRDYNYADAGAYFVTICTYERECLFGEVLGELVLLNDAGRLVQESWINIPAHFPHVELDAFVVMPNHLHGIIVLTDNMQPLLSVGAQHAAPDFELAQHAAPDFCFATQPRAQHAAPLRRNVLGAILPGSLCAIIRSFKSAVTKSRNVSAVGCAPAVPVWQRNYYERIVRDERELSFIRQYIADNPTKWGEDKNHPTPNINW
jgi:REP element-mobilizing transposase RayT